MKTFLKSGIPFIVAGGGILLLLVAYSIPRRSPPTVSPPAPGFSPSRLARIRDEGSLTRPSPEEEFLSVASKTTPAKPIPMDTKNPRQEAGRILGELRAIFAKMKALSEAYKKSDPARYASEMESLKGELAGLMEAARRLFKESDEAVQELFDRIRSEEDPVVKDRLAFLLRFVDPAKAGPFAATLSESASSADRKAAIGYLQGLRTQDSAQALLKRADQDPEVELRQRALVGLGRLLSAPSPDYGRYQAQVLETLRKYTEPSVEAPLRAAAWDAFSMVPSLSEEDRDRIWRAQRTEKEPEVRKSVENAIRHMNVRDKAAADRYNPKSRIIPR